MIKTIEGQLVSKGKKYAVTVSRFNDLVTKELLEGCIDTLRRHGAKDSEIKHWEGELLAEIKTLQKEYHQSSVDEVLAVRSMGVPESNEELMRISHGYYSSLKFIERSLEANPTAARELEEKIMKKHYAKEGGKPRNVSVKRSRTSGGQKVSTKPSKKLGLDFDFENAEEGAEDYLKEIRKLRNL